MTIPVRPWKARALFVSLPLFVVPLASSLLPSVASAAGPDTQACIAAFDDGQRARSDGRLRAAREKLLVCSQRECPGVLREDCAGVLREVDLATPTIVLAASDQDGKDLADVEVTLGGQTIATRLDGRAVTVDPGRLVLEFKRGAWSPVKVEIVVGQGEKNRNVRAVLGPPKEMADDRRDGNVPAPKRSLVGWAVPIGFAVLGVGSFAFAGSTRLRLGSEADDLRSTCAPTCPESDTEALRDDLAVANVLLGVGIGSLVLAGATWFILSPREPSAAPASGKTALSFGRGVTVRW
jgi:hypothetical protein